MSKLDGRLAGRLAGKVAIISGGARGQGEADARLFVAEGACVVLADVLDDDGERVAKELGDAARYAHLDVRSEGEWAAVVNLAVEEFGGVDILVNNAGIFRVVPLAQQTEAQFREVLDVNLIGAYLGMRAVVPAMTERGGGAIVNISSTAGLEGSPGLTAYTASKFALRGLTRSGALELARAGIRVNSVHPGAVDTAMIAGIGRGTDEERYSGVPLRRPAQPEELARLVLFLVCDESSYCTGSEFVADGGLTAGPYYPL